MSSPGATVASLRTTGIDQFLLFIYQILFPPGTTLHRQNEITTIISEITGVPIANFGFLREYIYIYIVLKVIRSQFQIQRKCVSVEGESRKEIAISQYDQN